MISRWTRHLGLKITSVCLSGVMWFVFSGARNLQEGQNAQSVDDIENAVINQAAPVHAAGEEWAVAGIPVKIAGGAPSSGHPVRVTVRLSGEKVDVDAALGEILAVVDAKDAGRDGMASVRVIVPARVRVVAVEPPSIHVWAGDNEGAR